jgi:DNA-binding LacI/PurR family transcriptional regulator
MLALADPPTAIFAASDDMALGAINAARERGLRVPEELAIVGFDDIPLTEELTPNLSTIRIPLARMGARVAELLMAPDELAGNGAIDLFPVELVRRASS